MRTNHETSSNNVGRILNYNIKIQTIGPEHLGKMIAVCKPHKIELIDHLVAEIVGGAGALGEGVMD